MKIRAIHGDLQQRVRLQAIKEIKEGMVQILLATDVASRGLDIEDLTHVFNFHIPDNADRFTHRIGRTGRAGKSGVAITLATPQDLRGHYFFKEYPVSKFQLESVPSLRELEEKMNRDLQEKIQKTPIHQSAQAVLEGFGPDVDLKQLTLKLLSLLRSQKGRVSGPDRIGLSPQEVMSSQSRKPYKRGGFFSKPGKGKKKSFGKKGSPKGSFRSRKSSR
jgi:ATP-dependent RNA helicase DeaD